MRKTIFRFFFLLILTSSVYAKPKEPMAYTLNLSEIAPKIIFQNDTNPKYNDQMLASVNVTHYIRKLIGRLPIPGDKITVLYEGSFEDYVFMIGKDMFIGLVDDSEEAGWYRELSNYVGFADLVSQNEQISTSLTFTVNKKPVTRCILRIGFHTTPEFTKNKPKLIAGVKTEEKVAVEKSVEENVIEAQSLAETDATDNQPQTEADATDSQSQATAVAAKGTHNWSSVTNVGLSFPQTFYTITGLEGESYTVADVDTQISTFGTHLSWLPTHKSGFTLKLGMDYGMGFVHPTEGDDEPSFVKSDIELLAGIGFTFGKERFRFRILGELGFGAISYNATRNNYISGMSVKTETDGTVVYFPIGVDVGMHIFFGDYRAVGLYLGSSFHAIPVMSSSASIVTKTSYNGKNYSSTNVYIYETESKFRWTPVIGVVLTF